MSKYERIYNFSAGPSMLPLEVLEECNRDMYNYHGSGMCVMEMSHRSKAFIEIAQDAEKLLREVMQIPDNYKVLFMQGGATLQFAALPLNLKRNGTADYIKTGNFSALSAKEAAKFIKVNIAGSSEETKYDRIPQQHELKLNPDADYVHICFNNTVYGTKFPYIPETGNVPLVADISSNILSEPLDVSRFGVLYAGVQKNIAPAGMALVIIREDLIQEPAADTPVMLNYKTMAEKESMYNTPNCWCIYVTKLVLEYIKSIGGVTEMQRRNVAKAALLYDYLDSSKLFKAGAEKDSRSIMNVIFSTGDEALDAQFVKEASALGMSNLKGHKVLGGMRASIYNNMPYEGVEALVNFMRAFEKKHV
ncbi:MAG: phosphoserine aminotransferase [Oscillospiraceae bacterium]|jgi:phosphoserine aminotransferase|nr:phosphoserine aminotransferase [Oscillospiraceae bacterium]